jgi:hypothetical protein
MRIDADDSWIERFGDRLNPILVKETRQALKSRQFSITFGLLLAASLLVSLGGVALAGPGLDYRSAGREFFLGYFVVLAFAVFVVVPFGAYRSLSTEQDERTFELLSISALKPRQIVAGKLLSAIIQMFIYYSAIAPYMGFTILLKGIDVPSIMVVLLCSALVSIGLCMIGLLLASLAKGRGWQVFVSVALITALLFATVMSFFAVTSMVMFVGPMLRDMTFWTGMLTVVCMYTTYLALAFQVSTAQLTFESDNRSSRIRVMLVLQFLTALAWTAYWWVTQPPANEFQVLAFMSLLFFVHWFVAGAFLAAEGPGFSKRVARQVPRRRALRSVVALFFPGPGTGLGFLSSNLICVVALVALIESISRLLGRPAAATPAIVSARWPSAVSLAAACYVYVYSGIGAFVVRSIRQWRNVPIIAGAAITWLIAAAGSLIPTFVALVLTDQKSPEYRIWQISDPIATIAELLQSSRFELALVAIPCGLAVLVGLMNLRPMVHAIREIHVAGQSAAS